MSFPTLTYRVAGLAMLLAGFTVFSVVQAQTCHTSTKDLQALRWQAAAEWFNISAGIGHYGDDLPTFQAEVRSRVTGNATLHSYGAGYFSPGPPSFLEYLYMFHPAVNNELMYYVQRQINKLSISWSGDTVAVDTWDTMYIKGEAEYSYSGTGHRITFEPCGTKITYVFTNLDTNALQKTAKASSLSAETLCTSIALFCKGRLLPFTDMRQCLLYFGSLSQRCQDGMHLFQGDTIQCRLLYLNTAQMDPAVGCTYVAPNSSTCRVDDCWSAKYAENLPVTRKQSGPKSSRRDTQITVITDATITVLIGMVLYLVLLAHGELIIAHIRTAKKKFDQQYDQLLGNLSLPLARQPSRKVLESPFGKAKDAVALDIVKEMASVASDSASLPEVGNTPIPCNMLFSDLTYRVSGKNILNGVFGHFKTGELTAIMGPSGAGKSTLMQLVMARQSRGELSGTVLRYTPKENGESKLRDLFWVRRKCAYVEQFDDLPPQLTVSEVLMYEALLVMPWSMPAEEKLQRVELAIADCHLMGCRSTRIELCSGGQRRLAMVAMQLVRSPACIFLDEPTSGLDAALACTIMNHLAALAGKGHTIVATIHQPRTKIFCLLDKLLLMGKGGYTIYFGPPQTLLNVLKDVEDTYLTVLKESTSAADCPFSQGVIQDLISMFKFLDENHSSTIDLEECISVLKHSAAPGINSAKASQDLQAFFQNMTHGKPMQFQMYFNYLSSLASEHMKPLPMPLDDPAVEPVASQNTSIFATLFGYAQTRNLPSRRFKTVKPKPVEDTLVFFKALLHDDVAEHLQPGESTFLWVLYRIARQRAEAWYGPMLDKVNADLLSLSPGDIIADLLNEPGNVLVTNERLADIQLAVKEEVVVLKQQIGDDKAAALMEYRSSWRITARPAEFNKMPNLPQRLCVRVPLMLQKLGLLAMHGYWIGCLIICGAVITLSPRIEKSSLQNLYLFTSLPLVASSALLNMGFFNCCIPWIQTEKRGFHRDYLNGTATGLEVFLFWFMRDAFITVIGNIIFFFPFYFGTGYNPKPMRLYECLLALWLFTGHAHAFGDLMAVSLPPTLAVLCCGIWMCYNALFCGVVVPVNKLWVLWKPWGAYIDPTFHLVNIFVVNLLHEEFTECPKDAAPMLCPPLGSMALEKIGYGQFNSIESMLVLLSYYIGLWLVLAVYLIYTAQYQAPRYNNSLAAEPLRWDERLRNAAGVIRQKSHRTASALLSPLISRAGSREIARTKSRRLASSDSQRLLDD